MPCTITKTIRGRKYTYFVYFEDGKTKQKYCGQVGSKQAKRRALEIEYELLEKKRDEISSRMATIKRKMPKRDTS